MPQKMLQSVEILQMNAQELAEYIRELSLENPVVDIEEAAAEDKGKERDRKLEWLASLDEQNRTYYQYDRRDKEDYMNNIGAKEGETLKDALMLQLIGNGYSELEMAVFEYIADSLNSSGYYTEGLVWDNGRRSGCLSGSNEETGACRSLRRLPERMHDKAD